MSNIVNFKEYCNRIVGEKVGTVLVSLYKDRKTGLPFFYVQPENEDVLQVSYIIEDTLYKF